MFINPREVIKNGWLKFPDWMNEEQAEKCIQPNAIDFTLDRVFKISGNIFSLSETKKRMRGGEEIIAVPDKEAGDKISLDKEIQIIKEQLYFGLDPQDSFDCLSDFYVKVPEGVCAVLFTRSTLVRNGLFWISGLYDSGFEGHIGGVIHTRRGGTQIYKGTRVGQIAFVHADSAGIYAGGWNHSQGTHYTEK